MNGLKAYLSATVIVTLIANASASWRVFRFQRTDSVNQLYSAIPDQASDHYFVVKHVGRHELFQWRYRKGLPEIVSNDGRRVVWLAPPRFDSNTPNSQACIQVWGADGVVKRYSFADLCPEPGVVGEPKRSGGAIRVWRGQFFDLGDRLQIRTWGTEKSEVITIEYETGEVVSRQSVDEWIAEPAAWVATDNERWQRLLKARVEVDRMFGLQGDALFDQMRVVVGHGIGLSFEQDVVAARAKVTALSPDRPYRIILVLTSIDLIYIDAPASPDGQAHRFSVANLGAVFRTDRPALRIALGPVVAW